MTVWLGGALEFNQKLLETIQEHEGMKSLHHCYGGYGVIRASVVPASHELENENYFIIFSHSKPV